MVLQIPALQQPGHMRTAVGEVVETLQLHNHEQRPERPGCSRYPNQPIGSLPSSGSRMMEFVFWASFALLFYIYFGYPLAVKAVAVLMPNPIATNDDYLPTVSILIAAYNEAKDIEATLRNKLALDYPREKLEVLVISDESEDGTDRIVEEVAAVAHIPIRLFRQVPRQGKTAGLNTLVPKANGRSEER